MDDAESIRTISAEIRDVIERIAIPDGLAAEITGAVAGLGDDTAVAVRSSATWEDSPTASFAGQQDSYLDITGSTAVLRHISMCWASLFTERAVTYRLRNGMDHRKARMAVVVQRMCPQTLPECSSPPTALSNRRISTVETVPGPGESLVSGREKPDVFKVRDGEIVGRTVAGGTPSLTDAQAIRLVDSGAADRNPFRQSAGHRMVPGRR